MPTVINVSQLELETKDVPVSDFSWKTSPRLAELVQSKDFQFDIRSLDPDSFSFPYHFHRNAEELFMIISGKAMLRAPDGFTEVKKNDLIFFEKGPSGAHQLFNHGDSACVYLDLRTTIGVDICEYPDSNKINILPYQEVYESSAKVSYYKGEENVRTKWPDDLIKK